MSDHCRECMPHDVPKGTTVVCGHLEHTREPAKGKSRHVVIAAGPPNPLDPIVDVLRQIAAG